MHDYHKAKDIVEYAVNLASQNNETKVSKITVLMGDSSGYTSDSVSLYFKEVSEGTICENAILEMHPIKATLVCPACAAEFPRKLMEYKCPKCGVEGVPSKTGTQVIIESVDF